MHSNFGDFQNIVWDPLIIVERVLVTHPKSENGRGCFVRTQVPSIISLMISMSKAGALACRLEQDRVRETEHFPLFQEHGF